MEFARAEYIEKLVAKKHNGRIKVITGIRRCGKSYLLFKLFVNYLHQNNVHDNQIVQLALDEIAMPNIEIQSSWTRILDRK